jgi:hypothetical protein
LEPAVGIKEQDDNWYYHETYKKDDCYYCVWEVVSSKICYTTVIEEGKANFGGVEAVDRDRKK